MHLDGLPRFTFMNKSIAEAVGSTMQTGLANYISTGRPMANDHYGWRTLIQPFLCW